MRWRKASTFHLTENALNTWVLLQGFAEQVVEDNR